MKPPPGMKLPRGKCLRLHKSIYGLKQVSWLFNQLLVSFFHQLGFTVCPIDTCLMYLVTTDGLILVAIYVDDILLCATSLTLADDITTQLEAKFNCVNLGKISWCLGMRIRTSDCLHIITLDLDHYIQTILARYEFDQLPAAPTPMLHDLKLSAADCPSTDAETKVMEDYPFRSAVTSLMFAMVAMRVDISYAVISVARFTANPGLPHWHALVRIFQHLKGTSAMQLTYSHVVDTPAPLLYGYSDADYWATTDIDERRTCIGYYVFFSGAAIFWLTRF